MDKQKRFFGGTIASYASLGELEDAIRAVSGDVPFELEAWDSKPLEAPHFRVLLDQTKCTPPDGCNAVWYKIRDALAAKWSAPDARVVHIIVN
jgi:hypothetical protein